jgi:hypothetical protein
MQVEVKGWAQWLNNMTGLAFYVRLAKPGWQDSVLYIQQYCCSIGLEQREIHVGVTKGSGPSKYIFL